MMRPALRQGLGLSALSLLAIMVVWLRYFIDRDPHGAAVSLAPPPPGVALFRLTAIAVAVIAGSSLAVSGVLLQALLRNPLASPFILGISAGAGLGVMVAISLTYDPDAVTRPASSSQGLAALLGALAVLGIVYLLGQRRGWLDPVSLVLVGVIVSAICGALIMLLHHLGPTTGLMQGKITRWMMGRIPEYPEPVTLIAAGGLAVVGGAAGMVMGRAMDAATLSDDEARSVGLALGPLRVGLFILAGALTAGAVALCGPIGFVGLIAPHAARLLVGPRHTPLVPAAALVGIVIMVGADAGRQAIELGAGRLPIGVLTALIGGPAFIWLLRTGRGQA